MNNKTIKQMRTKYFNLAIVFIMIIAMSACKKDQSNPQYSKTDPYAKILTFKNMEEYQQTLKEVSSLTSDERVAWEDAKGFKSFGRVCDEVYKNSQPEKFTTLEEFNELVSRESKYLYLDELPNGELSLEKRLCMNGNRFLINSNNIFQIGEKVYKVLEKGVASTKVENANKLKNVNDENLYSFLNQNEIELTIEVMGTRLDKALKDVQNNCGNTVSDYQSSGNDRTSMIKCGVEWILTSVRPYSQYNVSAYKRGAFFLPWVLVKRHISMDMKTRVDFLVDLTLSSEWKSANISFHNDDIFADVYTDKVYGDWVYGFNSGVYHFGGYDCWGDTPSSPVVNLECNLTIL